MTHKILLIDDEPKILETHLQILKGRYRVETAPDGPHGLAALKKSGEFSLIISDYNMPGMDGIEFLSTAEGISPFTTRMMLTVFNELEVALKAVNEGHIFRFLTKPLEPETLIQACEAGVRQYQMATTERDLLDKTLHGGVIILTELLALANPAAFSRAGRIRKYVNHIVSQLRLPDAWQYDLAATFSQIGGITIPPAVWEKTMSEVPLSDKEAEMLAAQPRIISALLSKVPRFEALAGMIEHQSDRFAPKSASGNLRAEDEILLGGHILRAATEFERLIARGRSQSDALAELRAPANEFATGVLDALASSGVASPDRTVKAVSVHELDESMILDEDVISQDGLLLAPKGQNVTTLMLERLSNFVHEVGVVEPIHVVVTS